MAALRPGASTGTTESDIADLHPIAYLMQQPFYSGPRILEPKPRNRESRDSEDNLSHLQCKLHQLYILFSFAPSLRKSALLYYGTSHHRVSYTLQP